MQLRLRELRESRNLSQQTIADSIGCSSVTYSRYETGQREPSLDMLVELAKFFNVSVDYLVGRTSPGESALSDFERMLVEASRDADSSVNEIVLDILKSKAQNNKK